MVERKASRPAKPRGRWVYYILADDILWPCPVHWEWVSDFSCWVPFYLAPSLEFIAGDPSRAVRFSDNSTSSRRKQSSISNSSKQE